MTDLFDRLLPITRRIDFDSAAHKEFVHQLADGRIVFHDQRAPTAMRLARRALTCGHVRSL